MRIQKYEIINGGEIVTLKLEAPDERGKMESRYAVWNDSKGDMYFGLTDSVFSHAVGQKVKDNCDKILDHLDKVIGFKEVNMCYKYKSDVKLPPQFEMLMDVPICTIKHLPEPVLDGLKKARNMIREVC